MQAPSLDGKGDVEDEGWAWMALGNGEATLAHRPAETHDEMSQSLEEAARAVDQAASTLFVAQEPVEQVQTVCMTFA